MISETCVVMANICIQCWEIVESQTNCDGRFCTWCHNVIVAEVLNAIRSNLTYSTLKAKLLTEGKTVHLMSFKLTL